MSLSIYLIWDAQNQPPFAGFFKVINQIELWRRQPGLGQILWLLITMTKSGTLNGFWPLKCKYIMEFWLSELCVFPFLSKFHTTWNFVHGRKYLPHVRPHYAVKCCPDKQVRPAVGFTVWLQVSNPPNLGPGHQTAPWGWMWLWLRHDAGLGILSCLKRLEVVCWSFRNMGMVVKIVNPLLAKRFLFNVFVANIYWDYFFGGERSDFSRLFDVWDTCHKQEHVSPTVLEPTYALKMLSVSQYPRRFVTTALVKEINTVLALGVSPQDIVSLGSFRAAHFPFLHIFGPLSVESFL